MQELQRRPALILRAGAICAGWAAAAAPKKQRGRRRGIPRRALGNCVSFAMGLTEWPLSVAKCFFGSLRICRLSLSLSVLGPESPAAATTAIDDL